ncbi:MAG: SusC/RagA family TonB-linked outer membrane protein [Bacteroidia bacterium]|nr:SusC/RagA family TonB-linked outer membrane protein [Bacteroidia bacterium]
MKLTTCFLLISFAGFAATGYSQPEKVTIQLKDASMKDLFNNIEHQTSYKFLYRDDAVENIRINLDEANIPLDQILNQALEGSKFGYKILANNLIVIAPTELLQQQKISGTVTDEKGNPLPGVTIVVKGTTLGSLTDASGKYSINNAPQDATLIFSFVGMTTQEITSDGRMLIDAVLKEEAVGLNEVIVIGYGTVKKSDLTGSVMRVETQSLKSQSNTQLTDMISGSVSGLYIKQGTSASGGASTMEIRGQTSLLANTDPLIVLDGAIYNGNIMDINPSDIATIDILKDASASAVFGAKAASGVVIITTTKGATGKPKISFSTTLGITESARKMKPFDAQGFLDFRRDLLESNKPESPFFYYNPTELPDTISIDKWRNYSANPNADNTLEWLGRLLFSSTETQNYLEGKTTDWYDNIMQKGNRQNYDFNIRGGTKDVSYYWSLGSTSNEGIIVGDKFSTIRSRLNVDMKVADYINIGVNTQFSNRDQSAVKANLNQMFRCSPYGSYGKYKEDGSLNFYPQENNQASNPLTDYYYNDLLDKTISLFSSLYVQLKLPFGLSYRLSYQPRFVFNNNYNFKPTTTSSATGSRSDSQTYEWIIDNLISWKKKIGVHDFDLTLLYSSEKNQYWSSYSSNANFTPNENLSYHGIEYGIYPFVSSNDTYSTGDAAMARLNYTLSEKYLLTTSIRRDGYSAFGQKNPRAFFPAVAFAWKISEEDFFKIDFINQMKLRLSWGINGNRDIGIYSALSTLSSNNYYDGSSAVVGVTSTRLANPNLVWEKTQATNFGLDFGLFKDRINISADYYISTTNDLLMSRRLPVITGLTNMTVNLGELANSGFEMTLNTANISTPNFNWKTNLVFSLNRNKINNLYGDYGPYVLKGDTIIGEQPDYINNWFPGHSIDAVWNYKVIGVWQLEEAAEAAKVGLKPGDYKTVDVNGDGLYTEFYDKQFLGYTIPRYNIGLRNDFTFFKNFTASVFIRADLGHISAMDLAKHTLSNVYDRINSEAVPYWTQYNAEPVWGRLNNYGGVYAGGYNVYFSRSFLRIQDLSLSYSFPQKYIQRMKLSNLRVFGSVRNLYSFDKWPDFDPESGSTPMPRTYTFGLSFEL